MSQPIIVDSAELILLQPRCPTCGVRMWLVGIEPDQPGHDLRTYECKACDETVTEVVKF